MDLLKRFEANSEGRDFVVGDLHGCYDQLEAALERVDFDPGRDRCFSVGDLTDRGPRSVDALHWLEQPWFHPCLGNHDEMVLKAPEDRDQMLWWILANGGQWWLETDASTRAALQDALARVPLALEVATPGGRVGIVHADVPEHLGWSGFLDALRAGNPDARHTALWGRDRADGTVRYPVVGIDRVVCGHTITQDRRVHVVGNVWLIDTGAFLPDGRLTLLPLTALFEGPSSPGLRV